MVRLQNFSSADFSDLEDVFKTHYGLSLETVDYSSESLNCGDLKFDGLLSIFKYCERSMFCWFFVHGPYFPLHFSGGNINFEAEGLPLFEIPLSGITQCVVPKASRKREVCVF